MTNGCWNGPAAIIVDDKVVCKTHFHDLIEVMPSSGHPIGRHNTITLDNAIVSILLFLLCITFLLIGISEVCIPKLFFVLSAIAYITNLLETILRSATLRTLWQHNKWIDLEVFKVWFYELKKCRPRLTFAYEPSKEEQDVFAKLMQQGNKCLDDYTQLKFKVVKQELNVVSKIAPITSKIIVSADFEFSLWSDISAESTEFMEQFNQLEQYKLLKLNVFTLFD